MQTGRLLVPEEGDGEGARRAAVALETIERPNDPLHRRRGNLGLRMPDGDVDEAAHDAAKAGRRRAQSSARACGRMRVSAMTGMKL